MNAKGYFAYRYERKYYWQRLSNDASPRGRGQQLANTIPKDPSAFNDWVADRVSTIKSAKIRLAEVVRPNEGVGADDLGFQVARRMKRRFIGGHNEWGYVIDLDNLVFTVNGFTHLKLDNMPPDLGRYKFSYRGGETNIPVQYLKTSVDLWHASDFDAEERQQKYDALEPIVVPVAEWGVPAWEALSVSQRVSIEITHYLLRKTSHLSTYAYLPGRRERTGTFCWDVLCASVPALPIFRDDDFENMALLSPQTLSCGFTIPRSHPAHRGRFRLRSDGPSNGDYFWIRGRLIKFCPVLNKPICVAHEVEQMVQKMRPGGYPEPVGIILSSQLELVVVAIDGVNVRHSPVLDIRTTPDDEKTPGYASEGRLLLTQLLSPPLTVPPLPWRTSKPCRPTSVPNLPPEALQIIIHNSDLETYLSLCQVSKLVHSVCVANPRIGSYTLLRKILGFKSKVPMLFTAWSSDDKNPKAISLSWRAVTYWTVRKVHQWNVKEVSSRGVDYLIRMRNTGYGPTI